jgi:hypothetical protein
MKKERGGNPLPAFGNPVRVKENLRDLWSFPALESVWRDVRHSARSLRRSPGFAGIAILSLAIGAGANTAMFSVVRTVMLKLSAGVRSTRVARSAGKLPKRIAVAIAMKSAIDRIDQSTRAS